MNRNFACAAGAIAVALTAAACGENPTSPSRIDSAFAPNTLNRTVTGDSGSTAFAEFTAADSGYVTFEASANLTLAEIGYLAHKNGDSLQVKGFGFQLWQDFRMAQEDLSNTAGASAIRNAQMNMADLATFNRLRRLSGSEFDKEFVRWVIEELAAQRTQVRAFRTGQSALVQAHAQGLDNETSRYINMARDMETYF